MALEFLPLPSGDIEEKGQVSAPPTEPDSPPSPPEATPTVRVLSESEIATLKDIFDERHVSLPNPAHSYFVGSVAPDGHVTSFLVIQLKVHAEPLWIEPGNEAIFRPLIHAAEKTIQEKVVGGCEVFLFAPAGKVARMAELAGMRMEPWVVYSKFVEGIPPTGEKEVIQ